MIPKATENTVTGILREELESRNVKTIQFPTLQTPVGRREPDLLCENGGRYLVEAKFSEQQLVDAIAKVQNDYLKHYKLLGIHGGFAVLYPKELTGPMPLDVIKKVAYETKFKLIAMFPPEDERPFTVIESRLPNIAETIADYVLQPPKRIEPNITYIISALRETANYIVAGLRHLSGKSLQDFFGGENVFKNILQYEEKEYPEEDLRLAAAYILVNQLLFYHVLASTKSYKFQVIDPDRINTPRDLEKYFHRVLDVNYRAVFAFKIASLIPPKFIDEIRKIISVIQGLAPEKVGGDLLGTIFHDLIPFDIRKKVAAYYTNVLAAELLATLAIDRADAKVADFAVGSGGLLVAAYRRKRELLERPMSQEDHRRFVEEDLLGVDVMPFAANIAACHLSLQSPEFFTDRANIAVWDATDLRPGTKIPSVAGISLVLTGQATLDTLMKQDTEIKGVVELSGRKEEIELGHIDVVIMNPPFTRQERIPEEYKVILLDRFKREYKDYLHGQLGYHGYFILLADKFLKEEGKMALVLPATILKIQSFEGIRRLLADKYHIEYIITTWYRSAFSEGARFREILLVARKIKRGTQSLTKTKIVSLKKLPISLFEAKRLAEKITTEENVNDLEMVIKTYDYTKFKQSLKNWFKYIATSDLGLPDLLDQLLSSARTLTMKQLIGLLNGQIIRGVETSRGGRIQALTICRPERAIKKADEWTVAVERSNAIIAKNRFNGAEIVIPLHSLRRTLRRISLINRIDVTNILDYVMTDNFEKSSHYFRVSSQRIRPPKWAVWRQYVEDRLSNLAVVRRVDISATGTHALAFYSDENFAPPGLAWSIRIDPENAKILCLWFNSTINILQMLIQRKETRGAFLQLDEYVLEELNVVDITKMSNDDKKLILGTFEKVRNLTLPSILEQLKNMHSARLWIDKAWLRVLGYKGDADFFLAGLYKSVADEIELLKRLMSEGKAIREREE